MVENTFTVSQLLIHIAASAPLLGTLVVGLVICYRQRVRRPRVAKLLGGALLAELIWLTCGWPLLYMAITWLGISNSYNMSDPDDSSWIFRMILHGLPGSMISAVIWGTALWAVLKVEDWQNESATI